MAKVIARPPAPDLYEEDFALWADRQAGLLRAKRFDQLDLENLIEEVEDLGRRERDAVDSDVETVLEHLLKLGLSTAGRPQRGWLVIVDKQRARLARKLATTRRRHLEAELPARSTTGFAGPWRDSWRRTASTGFAAAPAPLHARADPRSRLLPGQPARACGSEAVRSRCSPISCPYCGERNEIGFHRASQAPVSQAVSEPTLTVRKGVTVTNEVHESNPASLYEHDFAAWLDAQVAALRERRFAHLDLDNLIDEVESIRRAELRSVEHHARVVVAQLLQLAHSTLGDPRRSWKATADAHRDELDSRLTPTLRRDLESRFEKVYARGREIAATALETEGTDDAWLPRRCPYTLAEICEEGWFPTNVYGFDRLES